MAAPTLAARLAKYATELTFEKLTPEAVHEARLSARMELPENRPQTGEIRPMKAGAVDLGGRVDPHADLRGARRYRVEQVLSVLVRDLLRVVQEGQRAYAVTAERGVVGIADWWHRGEAIHCAAQDDHDHARVAGRR